MTRHQLKLIRGCNSGVESSKSINVSTNLVEIKKMLHFQLINNHFHEYDCSWRVSPQKSFAENVYDIVNINNDKYYHHKPIMLIPGSDGWVSSTSVPKIELED